MEKINFSEAFKALTAIDEDLFDITPEDSERLRNLLDDSDKFILTDVIDIEAEDEEEIQDSYEGKVILQCPICKENMFKNPEEVVIDEETDKANITEICPACQSLEGFYIVGEVKPYCDGCEKEEEKPEEVKDEVEVKDEEEIDFDEDKLDEALGLNKTLKEDWDWDGDLPKIANYILGNIKDKQEISWSDFEDLVGKGFMDVLNINLNDIYDEYYDAIVKIDGKERDLGEVIQDIRTILSLNGWGTEFEGDNEGGLRLVESTTKDNIDADKDNKKEKARKLLKKELDEATKKDWDSIEIIDKGNNWVKWYFRDGDTQYTGSAKVFAETSEYGINGGKVSKFNAKADKEEIANYDRGWDVRPKAEHKKAINEIIRQLEENTPNMDIDENLKENKQLNEEVPSEAYEVAEYINNLAKDRNFISYGSFNGLFNDAVRNLGLAREIYQDADFESDVRGILSFKGWETIIEGEDEGGIRKLEESLDSELISEFAYNYGLSKAEAKRRLSHLSKEEKEKKLKALKGVTKNNAKMEIETESVLTRDDIDANKDNKVEKAKKSFRKAQDDADADRDYKLKRKGLKESNFNGAFYGKQGADTDFPIEVRKYLNVELEDDGTEEGGVAFAGETLFDFLTSLDDDNLNTMEEVNKVLKACGIKPIEVKELKESDKPAATSIEDAQKWVDYDMKRYGKISNRTNRLIDKAGFQIIKDDHGDYEVAAGKFEGCNEAVEKEQFILVDKDGNEIKEKSKIKAFDGSECTFEMISRVPQPGKSGKITVITDEGDTMEYYPSVFDLKIIKKEGMEEDFTYRDGHKVKVFYDFNKAKEYAEKLGLIESEYGDKYNTKYSYCLWNKSGDRNEKEDVYAIYVFDEKGKPRALTDEEIEDVNIKWDLDTDKNLEEDFERVDIETDREKMSMTADENGKVTVTTEPKEEVEEIKDEIIEPVSDEVKAKFKTEDEFDEVDFDEFDEDTFDNLGEKYLRRVYENVKGFKTTGGSVRGNQLKLEGVITFKSGNKAKTNFVFESKTIGKNGQLKFEGYNKQFARGNKAFTLVGALKENKLVCESLTYNYTAKDNKTNESKKLYGTVRR